MLLPLPSAAVLPRWQHRSTVMGVATWLLLLTVACCTCVLLLHQLLACCTLQPPALCASITQLAHTDDEQPLPLQLVLQRFPPTAYVPLKLADSSSVAQANWNNTHRAPSAVLVAAMGQTKGTVRLASPAAAAAPGTHKISSQLSHFRFCPGGGGVSPKM